MHKTDLEILFGLKVPDVESLVERAMAQAYPKMKLIVPTLTVQRKDDHLEIGEGHKLGKSNSSGIPPPVRLHVSNFPLLSPKAPPTWKQALKYLDLRRPFLTKLPYKW